MWSAKRQAPKITLVYKKCRWVRSESIIPWASTLVFSYAATARGSHRYSCGPQRRHTCATPSVFTCMGVSAQVFCHFNQQAGIRLFSEFFKANSTSRNTSKIRPPFYCSWKLGPWKWYSWVRFVKCNCFKNKNWTLKLIFWCNRYQFRFDFCLGNTFYSIIFYYWIWVYLHFAY